VLVTVLLVAWPLTYRYSSVGLDVETPRAETVESRFYRVRWPGDGSVWVGWIDESRPAARGASGGVDLGALVLQEPRPMAPRSTWNELGFWWQDVVAARGDQPSAAAPQADRVMLVGVPHWLLVGSVVVLVTARRRRRADTRRRGGIRATSR
jgi:hypothetical protein